MTGGFKEINLEQKEGLKIVTIKFTDVLNKGDYELFVPQLEELMKSKDKMRLLIELDEFKGLTLGALWEETKFSFKHFDDIDRVAVVGEKKAGEPNTVLTKPFKWAEVRFFKTSEKGEAKQWLIEKKE